MAHDFETEQKAEWIEAELTNNESASDQELSLYFMNEGNMDKESVIIIMRQRAKALKNPLDFKLELEGVAF